ncbi:MAG: patatin-like phospholipase family protein [Candidatus Competibacteraceae bacterium]
MEPMNPSEDLSSANSNVAAQPSAMSNQTQPRSARVKLGLALSGGGFRASFFHIGVLAQLAMQGLLRRIEVISTVSGGSIIGALYYLHVRNLLEAKPDDTITDQDYKVLIERIEQDFFDAVKANFRLNTFANWIPNLRTKNSNYSHSDRIAELYDQWLYRPVFGANDSRPIEMRQLLIQPAGARTPFDPEQGNGARAAKVPVLVINATALNTGHNWRFTARQMGEPRLSELRTLIDNKPIRLRRPEDYKVARHKDFTLGHAVAASAAVPGIFTPLAVSEFYPDDIRVQLVDGGVHDNQGVQGLLDENCTHFIISDASQQMQFENEPATEINQVLNRSFSIVEEGIREEQLVRLFQITNAKTTNDISDSPVAFMHLRQGLPTKALAWVDPQTGKPAEQDQIRQPELSASTFHVDERVQDRLSKVRTDLDSFTEVEAYSLMLNGYLVTGAVVPRSGIAKLAPTEVKVDKKGWQFLQIAPWMAHPHEQYLDQLDVAHRQFFKFLYLIRPKRLGIAVRTVLTVAVLALFGVLIWILWNIRLSLGMLVLLAALIALFYYSRKLDILPIRRLRAHIDAVNRFVGRALLSLILTPILKLHLRFIDPIFLKLGEISRLKGDEATATRTKPR